MPVLMIGTYGEDGTPDVMNAAWGGITLEDEITICIDTSHKTWANIAARKAFTVAFGTADTVASCDYLGLVSGNKSPDKVAKSGFTVTKSAFVDAPIIPPAVTIATRLHAGSWKIFRRGPARSNEGSCPIFAVNSFKNGRFSVIKIRSSSPMKSLLRIGESILHGPRRSTSIENAVGSAAIFSNNDIMTTPSIKTACIIRRFLVKVN